MVLNGTIGKEFCVLSLLFVGSTRYSEESEEYEEEGRVRRTGGGGERRQHD